MSVAPLPMVADSWNAQVGSVWATLLSAHSLSRQGTVVEVGPGFADKVGLALATTGFRGTLFVVEPSRAARNWITRRYHHLLPETDIVPVAEPIPLAEALLPERVELLVMNHVLDDLVLNAALPPPDRERVFAQIRPDRPGSPDVKPTWQRLLADPAMLGGLCAQVAGDLAHLIASTRPRVFGASQYESWYLTANDLGAVDRLGARLLADLRAKIGTTSERDRALLRDHAHDPDRWLVREIDRPKGEQ